MSAPSITKGERAILALAVQFGCSISADMERRIRAYQRARVVDRLRDLDIFAISSHPSRRRLASSCAPGVDALKAEIQRDETLLIVRELRREARLSGALGLDADALELVAAQIEVEAS